MRNYIASQLREKAETILSEHKDLPITDVLDALVKKHDFSKVEFEPTAEISHIKGAVILNEEGKSIYIKADMPASEKTFVYAHEVAHMLLHSGEHMDFTAALKVKDPQRTDRETEANTLAYELIFPLDKFIKLYNENNGDMESLAICFEASVYRVKERIKFLIKQIHRNDIDDFITI